MSTRHLPFTVAPAVALTVALGGLAACTGGMHDPSTVEQQEGACLDLEGRRFASLDPHECGQTPDGVALCTWTLAFSSRDEVSSTFAWRYADVADVGHIECHGTAISNVSSSPRVVSGTFDPVTQRLLWDDKAYEPL